MHMLSGGSTLPDLGSGSHPLRGDAGVRAVGSAPEAGFRRIDTAVDHGTEHADGEPFVRRREEGRVCSIGVANITSGFPSREADETGVVPAVTRVELHPSSPREELRAFQVERQVVERARRAAPVTETAPVADSARAHGATAAQLRPDHA